MSEEQTTRRRTPQPDPSVNPASAPYEPGARVWRGLEEPGASEETTEVEVAPPAVVEPAPEEPAP